MGNRVNNRVAGKPPKSRATSKAGSIATADDRQSADKKRVRTATTSKVAAKKAPLRKGTAATGRRGLAAKVAGAAKATRVSSGTTSSSKPRSARVAAASAAIPRRAIFIDVENTSSQAALLEVIASLGIDRCKQPLDLVAVGNWRAVGPQVGRDLAALGAQLVHSAPARGVRDWSDLWIAVAAGAWIARATPGDVLEIVSNDRAFDAVGDAAAAQGVIYQRLQHRRGAAAPAPAEDAATAAAPRSRSRRGRRSRRPSAAATSAPPAVKAATPAVAAPPAAPDLGTADEPHGASRDQMLDLMRRLTVGRPSPWVNLDILESALKREGYSRPPGSARLVTRLRRLKDFEVDTHGRVRVVGADPQS